ncbi:YhgE/Pip domain-containing protein [Paenibacillus pasadenensis]|uniref:YhgE/Pip domain-containing protein n=1 Tax=Paenibacillus TaxID=44249 RepID=UPI00042601A1|nr:ABC transporter permease [Paenibacillus pasadenensis]
MQAKEKKLVLLAPVIALLIVFVFSLTLFPSVQIKPRQLPIAVVNEDQGVEISGQPKLNMGETIVETIRQAPTAPGEEPAVEWVVVKDEDAARQGLNDKDYYAALVIPQDFSAKQASLRTPSPSSPELRIYLNQGLNAAAATAAGQVLNGVVDTLSEKIRAQVLDAFQAQGATLSPDQAAALAVPIAKKVTNVNEIGTKSANGNAPISLFQPLWMASMACSAVLFLAFGKSAASDRKRSLATKLVHIGAGAVVALLVGFGFAWIAEAMIGLAIPQFVDTALFLALAFFSFFLLITAVVSWLGLKGIAVFALMLFFGAPLLALAPEMMSPFYRDWIHPWLPMRFMVDGLRELFFFGKGLSWNHAVAALTWIGAGGAAVTLASALKSGAAEKRRRQDSAFR